MPANILAFQRKHEESGPDLRPSAQTPGNKPGNGVVPPTTAPTMRITSILYYMVASICVQSATKCVLTVFNFNFPLTLCLAQQLFAAPICAHVSGAKLEWHTITSLLPLGLINATNIVAGLFGTGDLSVPMFIVLRRFTMVFTIILERFVCSQTHEWQVLAAVSTMIAGAIVAAATDLAFNLRGYIGILSNDLLTAVYLVMLKNLPAAKALDTWTLLYYNAIISVVPLTAASFAFGEPERMWSHPALSDPRFIAAATCAVCMGLTISHSMYVCTRVNDPLTTSVAGSLKNIIMTIIGAIAFNDYVYELRNVIGLTVSMVGALWYALYTAFKKTLR